MKKTIVIVLSLIFVFAITSLSIAAEKKEAPATAAPAAAAPAKVAPVKAEASKHVTGNVSAVDADAKTLTVKGKKADVVISVDVKTKITAGKEAKTLADIKAGDKVIVNYIEANGKNTAKRIGIQVAPPGEKK